MLNDQLAIIKQCSRFNYQTRNKKQTHAKGQMPNNKQDILHNDQLTINNYQTMLKVQLSNKQQDTRCKQTT
jgi:hypothetical protein